VIQSQANGRVHLLGIESPGLTAAPAIAEYVAKMLS
jgi:L-2-hydroxyglutarate oxidase LhgO